MTRIYTESGLIIPALEIMREKYPNEISTSQLIKELINRMKPAGHNSEIISGRTDTFFSQKVRNLKSHDTLTSKGLVEYSKAGKQGWWKITETGLKYLEEALPIVESLDEQGIRKEKMTEKQKKDFTEIIIEEGAMDLRTVKQRERSGKLRDMSIEEYKKKYNGEIFCEACGFNFGKTYGKWGENFIEIHHKEAIHTKDIEGDKTTLEKALKNVVPLCSNCHRMVHRKKGIMLATEQLRKFLSSNKS